MKEPISKQDWEKYIEDVVVYGIGLLTIKDGKIVHVPASEMYVIVPWYKRLWLWIKRRLP